MKERQLAKLVKAITSEAEFDDWWAGQDDVVYEDDNAREAVESYRAELRRIIGEEAKP